MLTVTFEPGRARRRISAVASGPPQSRRLFVSGAEIPKILSVTSFPAIDVWTVSPSTTRVSVPERPPSNVPARAACVSGHAARGDAGEQQHERADGEHASEAADHAPAQPGGEQQPERGS